MHWVAEILDRLAGQPAWGYRADSPAATEPTAWAALALLSHGRPADAQPLLDWLVGIQDAEGSLGISATEATPGWPTALGILAWRTHQLLWLAKAGANDPPSSADDRAKKLPYADPIERASVWARVHKGRPVEQTDQMGHNMQLIGWPWVENTHSWSEPTALHVLALKSVGHGQHERTREALTLLIDRLLPGGGCNYGNTIVLRQELRPHLQPTGLAMLALAGEEDRDGRIGHSLRFLERELSIDTTTASLCYGLLGLAAHGRLPRSADDWLQAARARAARRGDAPLDLALLATAAAGESAAPVTTPRGGAARL